MLSRYFNSINVDDEAKTLTKSSAHRDKLKYEVEFYKVANGTFRGLLPELIKYADDYSSYTLRYVAGKDVGEIYALDKCSVKQLDLVFKTAQVILNSFNDSLEKTTPEFLHKIFIEKALDRGRDLDSSALKEVFFSGIRLNGKSYPPLNDLLMKASSVVSGLDGRQIILHGDMCMSNILIEDETEKLFFVDPRGGFEYPSIYGPAVYDVAKLAQSVVGLYDLITNKQYALFKSDDGYVLNIYPTIFKRIAEQKFMDAISDFKLDEQSIKVLAGVMLAGAPIFHTDDENRAMAIALRAVELLG